MPKIGTKPAFLIVSALMVTSAAMFSGCGGAKEPEKNIKPGSNISVESEAKLKEMQGGFTPIKRVDAEEEAATKAPVNGAKKGGPKGVTKKAPAAPKGLIIRK